MSTMNKYHKTFHPSHFFSNTLRHWWLQFLRIFSIPGTRFVPKFTKVDEVPFDRKYLDQYNRLRCKPDLENPAGGRVRWSAKKITNVMAAWRAAFSTFGYALDEFQNENIVAWSSNKRMRLFLSHMTKWQIPEQMPTGSAFRYFGINPTRKELEAVFAAGLDELTMPETVIVGTNPTVIDKIILETKANRYGVSADVKTDNGILGPNKSVTVC